MTPLFQLLFDSLDQRLSLRRPSQAVLNKVFPHHWSFLLGEIALFSFVILILTGIFLTMFYNPSVQPVVYTGSFELYQGRELPGAYESIVRLSHDVPGGLLFRRLHRGAAYIFVGAVVLHLLRVLLTGAFRRPREVNYHVGLIMFTLVFALAATGQALPYDVIEGGALRIVQSFLLALPFVGEDVAFWIFGGEHFGDALPRFYVAHILILPGIVAGLIAVHLLILVRQRHTQFRKAGVDGDRYVVGKPMWPGQFVTSTALLIGMSGLLALAAVLAPWSDVSVHGPAAPGVISSTNHPDWWLAWVEGILVLWPAWEWFPIPGVVISAPFMSGVAVPAIVFGALFAYPWIDRRLYPFDGEVHELQRPLEAPLRSAIVLAGFVFTLVLSLGANSDYLSVFLGLRVEPIIAFFQSALLWAPAATFVGVVWWGRTLARRGVVEAGHGER